MKKVKNRLTHRARALGSPVEVHVKQERSAASDTRRLLREARASIKQGACAVAFSRLVDAVSYGGMAEAEAKGAGDPTKARQHAKDVVGVVTLFRSSCLK